MTYTNFLPIGANPKKFLSFFKVGGGFRAEDYTAIKHITDGHWINWDRKNPPTTYIDVGSGEIPDVWIKPENSVVIEVKAASVIKSDAFGTSHSLRFPRFKRWRDPSDKNWEAALSTDDFLRLKDEAEASLHEKKMTVDTKGKRISKRLKREIAIAGNDSKVRAPYAGPQSAVFEGLDFCVLSDMLRPAKKSKAEIEQLIKSNGGSIFQSATARANTVVIADKRVVKVASIIKANNANVVRPIWVLDAVQQSQVDGPGMQRLLIPFEPRHMFHTTQHAMHDIQGNVDPYGDSYARDVTADELKQILDEMIYPKNPPSSSFSPSSFLAQLSAHGRALDGDGDGDGEVPGALFSGQLIRFVPDDPDVVEETDPKLALQLRISKWHVRFAGGVVAGNDEDEDITQFVVVGGDGKGGKEVAEAVRRMIARSGRERVPRVVGMGWVGECWKEGTLLDEERFVV